ncbi:hypothetical protein QUB27_04810, partial [Microcoleus sp. AT8-B6]|uniref:hypothetical protein n=1 Tax=unclassified Microcoleus TaxID=2642155 RepID=UPI002FD3E7B4
LDFRFWIDSTDKSRGGYHMKKFACHFSGKLDVEQQLNQPEFFSVVSQQFCSCFSIFPLVDRVKSNFRHCNSEEFIDMPNGRGYSFKT